MGQSLRGDRDRIRSKVQGMVLSGRNIPEIKGELGRAVEMEGSEVGLGGIHRGVKVWNSHWGKREGATWGHLRTYPSCVSVLQTALPGNSDMNLCKCKT